MFVDASAMVAILTLEDDGAALRERLSRADRRLTSGIAVYEAVLAVARKLEVEVDDAEIMVARFLSASGISSIEIGLGIASAALDAHARFGKGRHPARLNMGDCFAYACARANGARLLYKGDDFALTDVEAA